MEEVLFVGAWLFVLTHIDTLIVLTAFCADEDYLRSEVLVGHFAGFTVGLAGAVIGAFIAAGLLQEWSFLLGVVPAGMGVWGLLRRRPEAEVLETETVPEPVSRIGVVTAAGIGLSGENLAVFIPFFAGLSVSELVSVVALYLVGAGLVFLAALVVVRLVPEARMPTWVDDWLVPAVLIGVGGYVLLAGWLL